MKSGGEQGRKGRRVLWLATAAAAGLLAVSATAASAEAQDKRIAIPAEDATASIPALARQSGLQVFAPTDALKGVRTNPVNGSFRPMEALNRLLAGTGLHAVQTGDNAVTIRRATPDGQAAQQTNSAQSGPPAASDQSNTVGEVVVTGTRIKRPGFDTLEAALSTNAKEIEDRGYQNIADALQDTPGFGIPGSSPLSAGQGRVGIAQSFVNIFGLGAQRTLTLVDGQRFVSSNTAQTAGSNGPPGDEVDLNLIPVGLIDHVETIAIGGAPVYGSDAIAGTVNIILKQHFSGVQMSGQYGITEKGDAPSARVSVLAGKNFADDRGNMIFSAEFDTQEGLRYSNRAGLVFDFPNPADTGPNDGIPAELFYGNVHFSFATEGGLPYDGNLLNYPGVTYPPFTGAGGNYIHDASGHPLQFNSKGELVPFNVGTVVASALGGGLPIESVGGDGVNAAYHFALLSPTKRALFNFNGHYDLDSDTRFFWESSFAHTQSTDLSDITSIDSPNLISSGAYTLNFSVNNPYLSSQARSIITAGYNNNPFLGPLQTFQLSRNLNDIVDKDPATNMENVYRIVAGFDGKVHPFGQDWSWNVSANYGESHTESHDNFINVDHLLLAIDAVKDSSGNIVCASGGNCVPIDLFGAGAASGKAISYVSDPVSSVSVNTQFVLNANLSGNLPFSIGGADKIAFNVGAEYREEGDAFKASAGWIAGDVLDGAPGYGNVSGSFNTKELYAETVVPLISPSEEVPLIKSAQYEGAVRYVDHSITGGATTWSSGGRLSPSFIDGLTLRGVFTHSIRSPSITEFGLPQTSSLNGLTDPCDAGQIGLGPDPSVRTANCTAALAAAGAAPAGTFSSTTQSLSQVGSSGGNPNLKNEVADSWSAGFVYQPVELPRFRFSADWSTISMKNAIELLGINEELAACYDSTSFPNAPTCSAFTRLTPATLSTDAKHRVVGDVAPGYLEGYFNNASIKFEGVILAAEYGFDLPSDMGSMNLGAKYFYTEKFDQLDLVGDPVTHEAGTAAAPRNRGAFTVAWQYRKFETSWQAQWTGKSSIDNTCTIEVLPQCYIPDYWLVSSSFSYKITDNLKAQLTVDNLFDQKMPALALDERLFSTYDILGRRYMFRLTASF
ncbi:MAG TPA: TonB-dependent receptor [Caulobacteraceae bacterium]